MNQNPIQNSTSGTKSRVNVLGVGISVLNLSIATQRILDAVKSRTKGFVCITGVHGVIESQSDVALRKIHNRAYLVTPDGMPMVWAGKLAGHREMGRVYGPDLMLEICRVSAEHNVKHFFYGGANNVAVELKVRLEKRYPGLNVVGTYEPPFRPLNDAEVRQLEEQVAQTQPDIFWVGLSTPKQEKFMAEFLPKLRATIMIGVGAAFDFHSGRVRQAPRWIQRSGFEWFYRLCSEPRRLWKRYLRNNPLFLWACFLQKTGLKKFELD
jgi:N-acetylglucosaminyldiphosphoundecaprenol N-acetyl-beta-D-mannosaminyltransferase